MSNYKTIPNKELNAAMEWLEELRYSKGMDEKENIHAHVLLNELREMIATWIAYQGMLAYQESFRERNALAQEIFVRRVQTASIPNTADSREVEWVIHQCLQLADHFLEKSGAKEKNLKVIRERLEHLTWEVKP